MDVLYEEANYSSSAIYWTAFCGNSTPFSAFWDKNLVIESVNPDLTDCFQKSILVWVPAAFLWIVSIFYVPYIWHRRRAHPWCHLTWLNLFKVVIGSLLTVVSACDLIWMTSKISTTNTTFELQPVDLIGAAVLFVTFLWSVILSYWTFRKYIHSSPFLFVFWLLELIVNSITFRSHIVRPDQSPVFTHVTTFLRFALVLLSFIACLFSDISPRSRASDYFLRQRECEPSVQPCPKLTASFLSVVFFWWFTPTIFKGWRRALTNDDIWAIREEDSSEHIVPIFEKNWGTEKINTAAKSVSKDRKVHSVENGVGSWQKYGTVTSVSKEDGKTSVVFEPSESHSEQHRKSKKPSLVSALTRTFFPYFSLAGVILLVYDFVAFANPFLLNLLLEFVKTKSPFTWHGYVYAVLMFCVSVTGVLCMHHHFNIAYTTGLRIRTALTSAIYRKALTISPASRRSATVGEIVNLMSVDTQKCQDAISFFHYIWSGPIIVVLCIYFLWQILGPSTMAGVGFMLVVLPINSMVLAKKIRDFQRLQMGLKDGRLKLMNQILSGIKVLKLYAWEPYFTNKILEIRNEELVVIRKAQIMGAVTYIMWFCSSFIVALLCFMAFVLSSPDHILDAQTAFVSMSLINLLNFPLTLLPSSIMFLVQGLVSVKRIEKFLLQEDIDEDNVQNDPMIDGAVTVQNGSFSWGDEEPTVLKNINMKVPTGKLVAVVGQVGCGKSSLLSAILGDMQKRDGLVNVNGSLAYAPQQAWIQNMSLRENILFSKSPDEDRYNKILDACALRPDLSILPAGDRTEIGERGINLSGGQKQRVSLARAVYQDADIYLLDDTLSAVDAHVGKHIFNEVIGPDGILKNKTRVLVTHGIGFLSKMDDIIVIKNGVISEHGTYEELLSHSGPFAEFINSYLHEANNGEVDEEAERQVIELQRQLSAVSQTDKSDGEGDGIRSRHSSGASIVSVNSQSHRLRRRRTPSHSVKSDSAKGEPTGELLPAVSNRLIADEVAEEGAVKLSVLQGYLKAATPIYPIIAFLALAGFIACQVCTNIWLSKWTQQPVINGTQDRHETNIYLGVYGGLGAAQTISVFGLALSISLGSVVASRNLHGGLLAGVLRCPMSFFDTTPLGRIVNRFSKDVDILDSNIPQFTQNLLITFAPLVSTIIVITYSTPIFVTVIVPLIVIFIVIQRVYVSCARQIKRIDSIRRSPMYAFFSETLNGTSSIRAYGQQHRFINHSDLLLDNSQRVWFEAFSSNRWIGVWAEFIGDLIIFFTAIFAVLQKDTLNPGLVGLSLSFALQVNMNIVLTVRSSCELETYIVAVERIKEYTELPSEAPLTSKQHPVPRDWPSDGVVEFKNYSTRYRLGLDLVLKDISCRVKSGEKVGIVGRTGAGKSSMSLALFRIIEPVTGYIEIDGCNICLTGLHDLRKKLTVIAQDPVLFSGTLRFNLDPSESFTNTEVWTALEHAHLRAFIETLPDNIYHECGEDGKNLSVGQRQLVCLARALLRKSKILVLDEATAAVDLETDDLIQSTIRSEFADCTVLTIAHRLNTVMDYDRVMVLQNGEIREFDAPSTLLANSQSSFYAMARDAGLV